MEALNELAARLSAVLGLVGDLRVSTSLVVLALVLWFGWRLLARGRGTEDRLDEAEPHLPADTRTAASSTPSPQETVVPDRTADVRPADSAAHPEMAPTGAGDGFRVRWDRTALALGALVLLTTFLVAGVAAAFGAGTGVLAGWSLVGALGCVAGLRVLAVRDRRRRPAGAPAQQAVAEAQPEADSRPVRRRVTDVFDAGAHEVQQRPTTPTGESSAPSASVAGGAPTPRHAAATTGEPMAAHTPNTGSAAAASAAGSARGAALSLPRPAYLDAPEVVRPAPRPMQDEDEDKRASAATRLKDGVSAEYRERVLARARMTAEDDEAARSEQVAALDLDNVLARRRAG
ncbi:putative membrane protein YedE/YeeE [Micrococcus cohnii]|uniref:Putative membrane protein YedE/YeeE n=1 Tax=Micrococcus cohnii TaxID=993416 RepID=A0A7W7GP11_9MICC|nr:hypothetical protein [Micrococcus cohnii]MBB4735652.1 putative membrane protein YedE/YeeE [Micrococcus cohnii]